MKRKLSLLLALVMILSLVPMSAFAASDNSVSKVPKVADDHKFNKTGDAPILRIEEDKNIDIVQGEAQIFRLKLDNAEWLDDGDVDQDKNGENGKKFKTFMGETSEMFFTRLTDTTVEVVVYGKNADNGNEDLFQIPMHVEMQGKGEAKVTVEPRDSTITGGTYVFAIGAGGNTVASVDSVKKFSDDNRELADLEIDEANAGAIGKVTGSKIKLKLPSDFKWMNASNVKVEFKGGLDKASKVGDVQIVNDNTMEIYFTNPETQGTRGTIFVKGLTISAKKDAKYGDVELSVSGDDISSEDLVVAKYMDYEVVVKADGDPKELVAGEMEMADTEAGDDAHKLQTLLIQEEVANAWLTDRKTRVEFPEWVKILKVEVTSDSDKIDRANLQEQFAELVTKDKDGAYSNRDENYVEFTVKKTGATDKAKVYLKFWVSVEANETDDIVAVVSGRSLGEDYEVVLGKAVAPVTIKTEPANVRTGVKGQSLGNITITEGKKEAIKKGELKVELDQYVDWTEVPTIKIVEGNLDLDIKGAKVKDNVLTIPVKSDSSKPAVIELSDIKVDLNRVIAEGDFLVQVGGDAVVKNYYEEKSKLLDEGFFKEEYAAEAVVARVITPADPNTMAGQEVKFVIDSAEYSVGDEVKTADVAPYIKDGRTMLSVRYVAQAMGVSEDSIIWNGEARTVTIFKGDRIAQITIGSNELMVNGTPIMMDTVAEIKDGRTMLPISFVAKALGATTEWDGATRTVTIK